MVDRYPYECCGFTSIEHKSATLVMAGRYELFLMKGALISSINLHPANHTKNLPQNSYTRY